jgi:hypothetical protein
MLKVGEWVRILSGPHIGRRGLVLEAYADSVIVQVSVFAARQAATERQFPLNYDEARRLRWAPRNDR